MRAIPYYVCTEKKSVVADDDFYGGYGAEVISVTEGRKTKQNKIKSSE